MLMLSNPQMIPSWRFSESSQHTGRNSADPENTDHVLPFMLYRLPVSVAEKQLP